MTQAFTSNSSETTSNPASVLHPKTKDLLDRYVLDTLELKARVKFNEELKEQIKTAINLGELDSIIYDGNRFQHGALTITGFQRKSWKYTQAVKDLQEQEQFNGTAEQVVTNSYRFNITDVQ